MRSHLGRTVTIFDVPQIVKTAQAAAMTNANIGLVSGFEKTGIYTYNRTLFTDLDFAAANVTDRPDPSEGVAAVDGVAAADVIAAADVVVAADVIVAADGFDCVDGVTQPRLSTPKPNIDNASAYVRHLTSSRFQRLTRKEECERNGAPAF